MLALVHSDDKTELIPFGTKQQLTKVNTFSCTVNSWAIDVISVAVVKDLGAWLYSRLDMGTRITKLYSAFFSHLYNLRCTWKFLSKKNTESLIHALFSSRLDGLLQAFCLAYPAVKSPISKDCKMRVLDSFNKPPSFVTFRQFSWATLVSSEITHEFLGILL